MAEFPHALVKDFAKPGWRAAKSVLLGTYGSLGGLEILNTLYLPGDLWVVNVSYVLGKGYNETGNAQMFLTGTIGPNEIADQAMVRELTQQIHMRPRNMQYLKIAGTKRIRVNHRPSRLVVWYACNVADLEPVSTVPEKIDSGMADSNHGYHKVSCLLYGTLNEMIALMERMPTMAPNVRQKIGGCVCLSVADMRRLMPLTYRIYGLADKFYWSADKSHHFAFSSRYAPKTLLANGAHEYAT